MATKKKRKAKYNIAEGLKRLRVPIRSLVLNPENAREHGEDDVMAVSRSLRKFGQRRLVVVRRSDNVVLVGNGRVEAARDILGWTHVAAIYVDDDVEESAAYAIADNRTAELADFNTENLSALFRTIEDDESLVGVTGFGPNEVEVMHALANQYEQGTPVQEDDDDPDYGFGEGVQVRDLDETVDDDDESHLFGFKVIVECEDEEHQKRVIDELRAEGIECTALIS